MNDIYLVLIIIAIILLAIGIFTKLYFYFNDKENICKMLNERVEYIYKNKEGFKKELIYVLSRYCISDKCKFITKNRINVSDGELLGDNYSFCLYVIYDKDFGNRSGCITKYILDMKYWDLFDIKVGLIDESTVWKTFDLREM